MSQHCHLAVNRRIENNPARLFLQRWQKKEEGIRWTQQFTLTVVGGEHHHGALGQFQLVQDGQQTTHLAVHVGHGSVVMLSYAQLE